MASVDVLNAGGLGNEAGGLGNEVGGLGNEVGGERQPVGGERQLSGGERQLSGGERQLSGGERQLSGGEPQLSGGERQLEVRRVGPDDWELFRRVRLAALAQSPDAFGSRHADWAHAEPERWRARLTDVPFNVVMIMNGEPAGMVGGTAVSNGVVELISLWVAPPARGLGVGDEAVRQVRDWAVTQGAERLVLSVKIDNTAARRLYLRTGFVVDGPSADDPSELVMSQPLTARGPD